MKRFTSLAALAACLLCPGLAPAAEVKGPSVWMPAAVSAAGRDIDDLYMRIMWIVVAIFVITQVLLIYSVFAFRARPGRKARYTHGSVGVELVLAAVPALILLYITLDSAKLWERVRLQGPGKEATHLQIMGEQFAWHARYPGSDATFGTADDVAVMADLAVPVGSPVVFHLSAKDVLHSFFLPESRVKQDCVPGLLGRAWTTWDLLPAWDLQAQKRVLLTPQEYEAAAVAVSGYKFITEDNPDKAGWYQASQSSAIGYKRYRYERDPEAKLEVRQGGKPAAKGAEPKYVRHYFELGCSQLCGSLHAYMRGTVKVLTAGEYAEWLAEQGKDKTWNEKWAKVWDEPHPEYNRAL